MTPHTTRVGPMTQVRSIAELASAAAELLGEMRGDEGFAVTGLAYDSRQAKQGDLFFCVPGTVTDGHDFAEEAIAAGAAGLVVEHPLELSVPQIVVDDARRAMARIAAAWHGHPADDILLVGITGTNGKTTTAYLLESILAAAGHTTGLIGTIETRVGRTSRPGVRTTPESVDLQALFAEMRDAHVTAVAMEVTSHGLAMHRVEALRFGSVAFTNLSQDHLDFHGNMEDYFAAKRSLFTPERAERGCANGDDPFGAKLVEQAEIPMIAFGQGAQSHVRAENVRMGPFGLEFVIAASGGGLASSEIKVATPLVGAFNVTNCLAACTTALQAGLEPGAVEAGIAAVRSVPGRFEAVDLGQPFTVAVDYAHTPDSLDNVLREARRLADNSHGRVVCLFGCGGDRDRGKRPLMGAAATRGADIVIVTSDNPRSEDPMAIIDEILEGVFTQRPQGPDAVLVNRREAITEALALAEPGDVVVIAGKGHETGQEFADKKIPFDDREVAGEVLKELGWGGVA
jgi:UDP-N-acetylmuramoyl-L-alanyl-D-glutamate--2,6-diaminopimelate ligase